MMKTLLLSLRRIYRAHGSQFVCIIQDKCWCVLLYIHFKWYTSLSYVFYHTLLLHCASHVQIKFSHSVWIFREWKIGKRCSKGASIFSHVLVLFPPLFFSFLLPIFLCYFSPKKHNNLRNIFLFLFGYNRDKVDFKF